MDDNEPPTNLEQKTGAVETLNSEKPYVCTFFYYGFCEGKNLNHEKYKDVTCFTDPDKYHGCDRFGDAIEYILTAPPRNYDLVPSFQENESKLAEVA